MGVKDRIKTSVCPHVGYFRGELELENRRHSEFVALDQDTKDRLIQLMLVLWNIYFEGQIFWEQKSF